MTLGRKNGKVKIKTDGSAGLRVVSCGCCGNCSFDAFTEGAVAPINPPKFKYITVEIDMPLYNRGGFDPSIPSSYAVCDGEGDFITCSEFSSNQSITTERKTTKITSRKKVVPNVFNQDGTPYCECSLVKAQGLHNYFSEGYTGKIQCWEGSEYNQPPCWYRSSLVQFNSTIQDAVWTTWQDENLKLFLDQKTSDPIWVNSLCSGEYWDESNYWTDTAHCPTSVRCGPGIYFSDFPSHMGPNSGWQYSQPLEGGVGFKARQFFREYWNPYGPVYETERHILHNTLAEVWGANQLEMRS